MKFRTLLLCLVSALLGLAAGFYLGSKYDLPFVSRRTTWSIGIYRGKSPLSLSPWPDVKQPVFTAAGVTDVPAEGVADPFLLRNGSTWYLFFEILNKKNGRGEIGYARSGDLLHWKYGKDVLKEPFHLSYPNVFRWKGKWYMVPESNQDRSIRLYEGAPFPDRWKYAGNLLQGAHFVDSSIFRYGGKWWIYTSYPENDILDLFFADKLRGPYRKHPASPIVSGDRRRARPGGRVVVDGKRVIRYAQDAFPHYGHRLRAFLVTTLTPTQYAEKEVPMTPVLGASGKGWNADGMHQVSPVPLPSGGWAAGVDGVNRNALVFTW